MSEMQADADRRFVAVTIAGESFGLPSEDVREIVPLPPKTRPLPLAEAHVLGLAELRDEIAYLLDLAPALGLGRTPQARAFSHAVLVDLPFGPVAVVLDGFDETWSVAPSDVAPQDGRAKPLPHCQGYVTRDGRRCALIALKSLLAEECGATSD